jgi:predicted MarR family transcription regulator
MMPRHENPVVDFLARLKALDKTGFTPRDVLIVYAIINKPGCSGIDVCNAIGVENHANIRCNLQRLQRFGLIEDRRDISAKAVPSVLVPLPKAHEFWESIKP